MPTTYLKRLYAVFASVCILSTQTLLGQTSSSACNGDNLLFYNATTGAGVSGKITSTGFSQNRTYLAGSIPVGATQVVQIDSGHTVLVYNSNTGAGEVGTLDHGVFTPIQTITDFSPRWSNILYIGLLNSLPLFYNAGTGDGAIGFAPTVSSPAFEAGWTHIVSDGPNMLFYNDNTGAGAVYTATFPTIPSGLKVIETKPFARGSFSTWTNLTVINGEILFYNSATGSAAVGRLVTSGGKGATNFVTDNKYAPNYFAPHWTHVIGTIGNLSLFYDAATGDAAIVAMSVPGKFSPTLPSAGVQFRTTAVLHRQVPAGFTHIVCSKDVQ